jgi:hypothetical protein
MTKQRPRAYFWIFDGNVWHIGFWSPISKSWMFNGSSQDMPQTKMDRFGWTVGEQIEFPAIPEKG